MELIAPSVRGRCSCGAVRFVLGGPLRPVVNCHCRRCCRWTGHFMAATGIETGGLTIEGGHDRVKWWTPAEEPTVAYGSCSVCSSSLFWRSEFEPDRLSVAAGTLDPPTGLSTAAAIFTDDAGDYHRLDGDLPSHPREGDPVTDPSR